MNTEETHQLNNFKIQNIRGIQGRKSTFSYKDEVITIEWSIQWDDRLNCFFIFAFPTPVLGILVEEETVKIFPVSGNKTMQNKARAMVEEIVIKSSRDQNGTN